MAYFAEMYSHMRRWGIIPHAMFLDETNVDALSGVDFVFLCIDRAPAKRTIVRYLAAHRIPFIDVGMGVLRNEDGLLGGIVRVTTSTPETGRKLHRIFLSPTTTEVSTSTRRIFKSRTSTP